jgi:hypothetical protein
VSAAIAGWFLLNIAFAVFAINIPHTYVGGPDFPRTILLVGNIAIAAFLIYYRYRRRERWIQDEAARWLVRKKRESADVIRRRDRALRRALWIPSLFALAAFFFLPETFGMGLRLFYRGTADIHGHRIKAPITWWAFAEGPSPSGSGDFYLSAYVSKGIGHVGFSPYWHREPPFSSILFYAASGTWDEHDIPPPDNLVVSKRVLPFGKATLTCWEIAGTPYVRISCATSSHDFTAQFGGERADVDGFYKVLELATHTK